MARHLSRAGPDGRFIEAVRGDRPGSDAALRNTGLRLPVRGQWSDTARIPTADAKPPLEPGAQRSLERARSVVIERRGAETVDALRPFVRDSWVRAMAANVEPGLRCAPLVASAEALRQRGERSPWLRVAEAELRRHTEQFAGSGHVLCLFDAGGQMMFADGDPRILDAMQDIHFMPGALWSEAAVGTNGPGTALALGLPVHVVGAEHFCAAWQPWHCAALPIRDPVHRDVIGAVDLSGSRDAAHPLALGMVSAVGRAVEHAIARVLLERRARLLSALAEVTARHPDQPVVAVDDTRRVVGASPHLPELSPGRAWGPGAPPIDEEIVVRHDGQILGTCVIVAGRRSRKAAVVDSGPASSAARYRLSDLIGDEPRVVEARRLASVAARNHLPVLITGESGVGKEVVAQAIHAASARASQPFIAVNCAAIPRELVESELFGYVGGAFSGARSAGSPGKIVAASGGTLFLDEVLELPTTAQAALLRVLQEGEVTAVGGVRPQRVDVRVIAATNQAIDRALATGALRRDFYHRLNVLAIHLPPLRERGGDVVVLLDHVLEGACRELGRGPIEVAPDALAVLYAHAWPGNVRELKNLVCRVVATAEGQRIEISDLPDELRGTASAPCVADGADGVGLAAVVETSRTMAEAAARLGVDRSTLYRRMAKQGLRRKATLVDG